MSYFRTWQVAFPLLLDIPSVNVKFLGYVMTGGGAAQQNHWCFPPLRCRKLDAMPREASASVLITLKSAWAIFSATCEEDTSV